MYQISLDNSHYSGGDRELKTSDVYSKLEHCIKLQKAQKGECPQNKSKLDFSLARYIEPQSNY